MSEARVSASSSASVPAATLVAVGDLMLGDSSICVGFGVHSRRPGERVAELLDALRPRLVADVVFGNLECLLTEHGAGATRWKRDQMRADPSCARALREAGFTVLSVANNHATQHGAAAFDETVAHLRAAGVAVAGLRGDGAWCATPVVVPTSGGRRVGLLGYCWRPRQYGRATPPFAEGTPDEVARDVERLRAEVDEVVVSLHWGEEFVSLPSRDEVAQADRLVEAGAALVLGHHPHVARPVVRRARAAVAYSLGNCVTDMIWHDPLRHGLLLEATLEGGVRDVRAWPLHVEADFAPRVGAEPTPVSEGVSPLGGDAYGRAVHVTVGAQRLAAYRYALANAWRFPPAVLAELVTTTLRNKLQALRPRAAT